MKKLILLLLFFTAGLTLQAQWLNVFYPDLKRVVFPTATTGYAIGGGGELLKTTDGGVTWVLKPTPLTQDLFSINHTFSSLPFF